MQVSYVVRQSHSSPRMKHCIFAECGTLRTTWSSEPGGGIGMGLHLAKDNQSKLAQARCIETSGARNVAARMHAFPVNCMSDSACLYKKTP